LEYHFKVSANHVPVFGNALQHLNYLLIRMVRHKMYTLATRFIHYSKTITWCSPMHTEGNELCIIYPLIYGSVV